ncbi:SprT-like family [Popillia japonica]|uniref:SprT-like family n=1 Tax=Popillia japonica TaxID=7064 RepID=A0AAW1MCU1_POPJA
MAKNEEVEDFSILLSTMSPNTNKSFKKTRNKKVSKLALKTQVRRSSIYDKLPHISQHVVSGSETTETWSSSSGNSTEETEYKNNKSENLNKLTHNPLKFNEIEKWIAQINIEQNKVEDIEAYNETVFSEVSTIISDHQKMHEIVDDSNINFAANSTFVNDRNCFRFDEMFQQKRIEPVNHVTEKDNIDIMCKPNDEASDRNEDNHSIVIINDSYEEKQQFETPVKNKNEINEDENLLDELYGNSWRANKERVLTFSEPKSKKRGKMKEDKMGSKTERKPKASITHKNPYLMTEIEKSKSLIRTLQSARLQMMIESPLSTRFKDIYDTESSNENLYNKSPMNCNKKLTFDVGDSDDEVNNLQVQNTEDHFDKFINKTPRKNKKISSNNEKNITNVESSNKHRSFKITSFPDQTKNQNFEMENKENIIDNEKHINYSFSSIEFEFESVPTNFDLIKMKDNNKELKNQKNDYNINKTTMDKFDFDSIIRSLEDKLRNNVDLNEKSTVATTIKDKDSFTKIKTNTSNDKNNINNIAKGDKQYKNNVKYCDSNSINSDIEDKIYINRKHSQIKSNEQLSFLASLCASVPVDKCDASAKIFRNTYKSTKEELAKRLFELYNEKIFSNGIPKDTILEWSDRMRGTAGFCYCKKITRRTGIIERTAKIVLATKIVDSADRLRDTLVHEMCHAATWIVNEISDGHGPYWKAWAARAMKAFPELPPIKRCHDYAINTKYTYKCTECGYSFGRHTKSLDIERKCCGYCHGRFEIFINKTTKSGKKAMTPVTPKKQATGFALFVKENYSNVKQDNVTHAEVMKILSKKFAEVKTK